MGRPPKDHKIEAKNEQVETNQQVQLTHKTLGTFQNPATKTWHVSVVAYNPLTGDAKLVEVIDCEDKYEAGEVFKLKAVDLELI